MLSTKKPTQLTCISYQTLNSLHAPKSKPNEKNLSQLQRQIGKQLATGRRNKKRCNKRFKTQMQRCLTFNGPLVQVLQGLLLVRREEILLRALPNQQTRKSVITALKTVVAIKLGSLNPLIPPVIWFYCLD